MFTNLLQTIKIKKKDTPKKPSRHHPKRSTGLINFRDLGGLPTTDHGVTRFYRVYRSAQPGTITREGEEMLRDMGISRVFDLRSKGETGWYGPAMGVREISGIEREEVPVFGYSTAVREPTKKKGSASRVGLEEDYRRILANGGPAFGHILRHLRDNPDEAVMFHCTFGRDRTGVLAALILELVGVKEVDIKLDYCLSGPGLAKWKVFFHRILMEENPCLQNRIAFRNLFSFRQSDIAYVLGLIRGIYGGAEGYVKQLCGLGDVDIEILKDILVDKDGK